MRSLLEKALVYVVNGDDDKATALLHKFIVERARELHESLRQSDDIQLREGWDSEIQEEEYMDDLGADDDTEADGPPMADGGMGDVGDVGAGSDAAPDMVGDDAGAEMGNVGDVDPDADPDGMGALGGEEDGDIESQIDHVEAQMDELSSKFDELMSKLDAQLGGEEDLGGDDDLGDLGDLGDEGDGDSEFGGDGEGDLGDVVDTEATTGEGGEEADDLADQMEGDMSDKDQPEHEMAEDADFDTDGDDEMMEDITESVLAELDRVSAPGNSSKEIGSGGKSVSDDRSNGMLPKHPANNRSEQAKPYMVKGGNNDSFERETAPSTKDVNITARNNKAGVKKLTKVPPKGDGSAAINSDFASRPATQSTIDGKKSSK